MIRFRRRISSCESSSLPGEAEIIGPSAICGEGLSLSQSGVIYQHVNGSEPFDRSVDHSLHG